jgi:hypothetical protein
MAGARALVLEELKYRWFSSHFGFDMGYLMGILLVERV